MPNTIFDWVKNAHNKSAVKLAPPTRDNLKLACRIILEVLSSLPSPPLRSKTRFFYSKNVFSDVNVRFALLWKMYSWPDQEETEIWVIFSEGETAVLITCSLCPPVGNTKGNNGLITMDTEWLHTRFHSNIRYASATQYERQTNQCDSRSLFIGGI